MPTSSDSIQKKEIVVLGSTGSIGTQTLDIISDYPDRFRAAVLTAGHNWRLLAEQARKFRPDLAVIADRDAYPLLRDALKDTDVEVACGDEAIADAAAWSSADMVVTAMVGYSGLIPTIRAIRAGKRIALANKETLVVGGSLIYSLPEMTPDTIVPVDSEHSAIFQSLLSGRREEMSKIILTASGGPFRRHTREQLETVTVADALNHPNWDMGAKVTIDSASMMNKGFEMIEAHWLFGCEPERIEIVVHPQSIVHSMVEFHDGAVIAQLGVPDMHLPIQYALSYPERLPSSRPKLTLSQYADLTFERPDPERFPMLGLAFDAVSAGGNMTCVLNAANEIGVAAFLRGAIRFTDLQRVATETMQKASHVAAPSLDDLIASNAEARSIAESVVEQIKL